MTPALARAVRVRQNADVQNHSKAIIEVLEKLPSWVDFDPDPNKWSREQIQHRLPAWGIWPHDWKEDGPPTPKETLWCVFYRGSLIAWLDRSHGALETSAPGSLGPYSGVVDELRRRPAEVHPPDEVMRHFRAVATHQRGSGEDLLVIRNEWIERATAASVVREIIRPRLHETRRLVIQEGLDPAPLDELMKSTYMQDEVVDRAVAVLRRIDPPPRETEGRPVVSAGISKTLTGKDAAKVIRVSASTLSRWHGDTPAWAREDKRLFTQLLERADGSYHHDRIARLAAWYRAAMATRGQVPTPCP